MKGTRRPPGLRDAEFLDWLEAQCIRTPGGCLEYQKERDKDGYGRITYVEKRWKISRLVVTLIDGNIPSGVVIRHTCDNPACCWPYHLVQGSLSENSRDRETRGRGVGHTRSTNPKTKLSPSDYEEAKEHLRAKKLTQRQIAALYGVCQQFISKMNIGKA